MKKIMILSVVILVSGGISGQNMTNSPSSMFGLGDISTGEGGMYAGMGDVSIALRSPNFLNTANPASLTGISRQKLLFNVGVMGAIKEYSQFNTSSSSLVGNVGNVGIGFRILPRWYGAASLSPVSSVGYHITLEQQVEGSPGSVISSQFEGEGGISKLSLTNAFLLTKRLSAGVNFSYITGSITQKELQGSATIEEKSEKRAVYADVGLQYNHPLNKDRSITVGAVYGYSQRLAQDNSIAVGSTSGSESIDESQRSVRQYLPAFYGFGAAYNSLRWIATVEYKYMDWSKMKSSRSGIRYDNQHKVALGVSHVAGNPNKLPVQIMLGAGYYNSYVVIKNEKPQNFYVSAGMGFTTQNSSTISFGIKYNDQFNVSTATQKERVLSLFLNIAFSERSYRFKLK
jgi:hypothetical protein